MLKRLTNWFKAKTTKPLRRINLTDFAVRVSQREGKQKQVDIAQISEVLSIALDILAEEAIDNPAGLAELMNRRVAKIKRRRKLSVA